METGQKKTGNTPDSRFHAPGLEVVVPSVEWQQGQGFIRMESMTGRIRPWLSCDFQWTTILLPAACCLPQATSRNDSSHVVSGKGTLPGSLLGSHLVMESAEGYLKLTVCYWALDLCHALYRALIMPWALSIPCEAILTCFPHCRWGHSKEVSGPTRVLQPVSGTGSTGSQVWLKGAQIRDEEHPLSVWSRPQAPALTAPTSSLASTVELWPPRGKGHQAVSPGLGVFCFCTPPAPPNTHTRTAWCSQRSKEASYRSFPFGGVGRGILLPTPTPLLLQRGVGAPGLPAAEPQGVEEQGQCPKSAALCVQTAGGGRPQHGLQHLLPLVFSTLT